MPGVDDRHPQQLVRRRLPGPEELLRADRRRARAVHAIYTEFKLPPEQMKAWLADRQGAIVGATSPSASAGRSAIASRSRRRSGSRRAAARPGSSTSSASTTARPASTRRSSSSATTTSTRRGPSGEGMVGWYIVKINAHPQALQMARRSTRCSPTRGGDQDDDREGLHRGLRQADRRHRRDRDRDPGGGALHDAAGGRQHDGAVGARAHQRTGGAEDAGLLERRVLALVLGRVGAGRRRRRRRSACSWLADRSAAIRPAACCRSSPCRAATS